MAHSAAICHPAIPADEVDSTESARMCRRCLGLLPRVAWERDESESCQRGTVGCCVDHDGNEECETW